MNAVQESIREALAAHADPERAAAQQAYMRSKMPFYGLPMSVVRREVRRAVETDSCASRCEGRLRPEPRDVTPSDVRLLWAEATHREERYAAITLLRHGVSREWAHDPSPETLDLLRHLITTGAWWDLVDEIASHCVGDLLRAHPAVMAPVLRGWSREPDLWLRRTAIISQLRSGDAMDLDLLTFAIEGSVDDPDFFARKAIGWALRQHARSDPAWVRAYVDANRDRLSPLSVREALKHL